MITRQEFLVQARIEVTVLETWVEAGWIVPQRQGEDLAFAEVDLARARLIRELGNDLGVNPEGISIVLDLLDQVHGLRRTVRTLAQELRSARTAERERG